MKHLKKLEEEVSAWPHISIHPHRFGGMEFQFGDAEVGHVHTNGVVDIPFPRSVRDALLELSGKFTNQSMQQLNYQVDGEHRPVAQVAAAFLKEMYGKR